MQFEMRKIHRWVSIIAALFLFVVATTGVILQVQKLTGDGDKAEGLSASNVTTSTKNIVFATMLARTAR